MVDAELTLEKGESITVRTVLDERGHGENTNVHVWCDRDGIVHVSAWTGNSRREAEEYNRAHEDVVEAGGDIIQLEFSGREIVKEKKPT